MNVFIIVKNDGWDTPYNTDIFSTREIAEECLDMMKYFSHYKVIEVKIIDKSFEKFNGYYS